MLLKNILTWIYNNPSSLVLLSLFISGIFILIFFAGKKIGNLQRDIYWKNKIPFIREDAIKRSRAVLSGQFSEQLAPFLPDFKYNPQDCKFLGNPIDLIIFNGMSKTDISEVVFLEIKSGESNLSKQERILRDCIQKGNVRWEEYRIPLELTQKKSVL